MSNRVKYFISNVGIGDLIFFCAEVVLRNKLEEELVIELNPKSFLENKDNSDHYKSFCKSLIEYLLEGYKILWYDDANTESTPWFPNSKIYEKVALVDSIQDHFKKKLHTKNLTEYSNSIVIVTKVRDLYYEVFKSLSDSFFKCVNETNLDIVLIGEQDINFNKEYKQLGKEMVYSIYPDLIEKLNKEKIIDLTSVKYNNEDHNLLDFLEKVNIIYNSKSTIIFGGGGFFCASLFFENLISLTYEKRVRENNPRSDKKIFYNADEFINSIYNINK